MQDLAKKILGKIKTEKIKPVSKWNFIFKKSFIWSLFGISVLLGGLAFGSILSQINNTEWELYPYISHNIFHFIFLTLPYLWILFLLIFSTLAFYYLRHTSQGYRYNTIIVISASIFIAVILGSTLFASGISEKLENNVKQNFPIYHKMMENHSKIWMMPEKGLLAGEIIQIIDLNQLKLKDLHNQNWQVDISKATWSLGLLPKEHLQIKIIGEKEDELLFLAKEIRPWRRMQHSEDCTFNQEKIIPCKIHQKNMKENFRQMRIK